MLRLIKPVNKDLELDLNLYHPIEKNGRFYNCWDCNISSSLGIFLKWKLLGKSEINLPEIHKLDITLPIDKPDFSYDKNIIKLTWIGHSTVLISFFGLNILTDPIFSDYASPIPTYGLKRYRKTPCCIDNLPRIDMVLISHNHYDHLDLYSVMKLSQKFPHIIWFVPKHLKNWFDNLTHKSDYLDAPLLSLLNINTYTEYINNAFHKTNENKNNTVEMSWWESTMYAKDFDDETTILVQVTFVPAQHWCKRSLNDDNKVLWGGWAIKAMPIDIQIKGDENIHENQMNEYLKSFEGKAKSFYFAGDTGFHEPMFEQIHKIMGDFDICALPIGAYKPRWVLKDHHMDPEEAVKVHKILKSKLSIGIHWGTFALSDEFYLEPREKLRTECLKSHVTDKEFFTINQGQTITL